MTPKATRGPKGWLKGYARSIFDTTDVPKPRSAPPVFDLAGDRIRSKTMSGVIFLIILVFVSTLIFPAIFSNPMPRLGEPEAADIDISAGPADNIDIGGHLLSEYGGPIKIWLKNSAGYPVSGVNVSLKFEPMKFSDRSSYDICSFVFRNEDFLLESPGRIFLPYYKWSEDKVQVAERFQPFMESGACELVARGNLTVLTDSDGIASFDDLVITSAVPGEYKVTITANNVTYSMSVNLVSKELVTNGNDLPQQIEARKPTSISLRLTDTDGQPAANRVVYILSSQGIYGSERLAGVYTNNTATTDASGIVKFGQLTLSDHTDAYASITVVSNGQVLLWKRVKVLDNSVRVKNAKATKINEFTYELSATVTDDITQAPLAGRRVFVATYSYGTQVVLMNQYLDASTHGDDYMLDGYDFNELPNRYKVTMDSTSPPSDAVGNVKWRVTLTSVGAAGSYTLRLRGGEIDSYDNEAFVTTADISEPSVANIELLAVHYLYWPDLYPMTYALILRLTDKDNKPCAYYDIDSIEAKFEDCSSGMCTDTSAEFLTKRVSVHSKWLADDDGIIEVNVVVYSVSDVAYIDDASRLTFTVKAGTATFTIGDTVTPDEKQLIKLNLEHPQLSAVEWSLVVSDELVSEPYDSVDKPHLVTQHAVLSVSGIPATFVSCDVMVVCAAGDNYEGATFDAPGKFNVTCSQKNNLAATYIVTARVTKCTMADDSKYDMFLPPLFAAVEVLPEWKSVALNGGFDDAILPTYDDVTGNVEWEFNVKVIKTAWFLGMEYAGGDVEVLEEDSKSISFNVTKTIPASWLTVQDATSLDDYVHSSSSYEGTDMFEAENTVYVLLMPYNVTFDPVPPVDVDSSSTTTFYVTVTMDIPFSYAPYIKADEGLLVYQSVYCDFDLSQCTAMFQLLGVGAEPSLAYDISVCLPHISLEEEDMLEVCEPVKLNIITTPPLEMEVQWAQGDTAQVILCYNDETTCRKPLENIFITSAVGKSHMLLAMFTVEDGIYLAPYSGHVTVQEMGGSYNKTFPFEINPDSKFVIYTFNAEKRGVFRVSAHTGLKKTEFDVFVTVLDMQMEPLFTQAAIESKVKTVSTKPTYVVGQSDLLLSVQFRGPQDEVWTRVGGYYYNPWVPLPLGGLDFEYYLIKETACMEVYALAMEDDTMNYYDYKELLSTCPIPSGGQAYISSLEGHVTKLKDETVARPTSIPKLTTKTGGFNTNWDHVCQAKNTHLITEAPTGTYYLVLKRGSAIELASSVEISQSQRMSPIDTSVKVVRINVVNPIVAAKWASQPRGLEKKDPWSTETQALVGKASSLDQGDLTIDLANVQGDKLQLMRNLRVVCRAHNVTNMSYVYEDVELAYDTIEPSLQGTTLHVKLNGLRFNKAPTGEYRLSVGVAGVYTTPSDVITVRDRYDGNTDAMSNMETFLYIGAAASVPLFWGNADMHSPWSILVAAVAGVVMIVVFLIFMFLPQFETGSPDEFALVFYCVFLAILVLFLFMLVWAMYTHMRRRKRSKVDGESSHNPIRPKDLVLVRSLLDPTFKRNLFSEDMDTQRDAQERYLLGFVPKKKLRLLRKHHMDDTSPDDDAKRLKNPKDEINQGTFMQKIWKRVKFTLRLKIKKMLWVEEMNLHKPFEKHARVPQRMVFACVSSLWLCVIIAMFCVVGTVWFDYQMETVRLAALEHRLEISNMIQKYSTNVEAGIEFFKMINKDFGSDPHAKYPSSFDELYASSKEMSWKDRFMFMFNTGLGFLTGSNPSGVSSAASSLVSNSGAWLNGFLDMLVTTVYFAVNAGAVLSWLIMFFIWRSMINRYKANTYLLRQSKYWFNSKDDFPAFKACFYVGIQIGKMLLVNVVMTILLVAVCLVLSFLQYNVTITLVISIGTPLISVAALLRTVLDQVGRSVTTDGKQMVTRPNIFALYDFVMLIIYLFGGLISSIIGFIGTIKKALTRFARCDTPLIFTDPSYPPVHPPWENDDAYCSYMAMLLLHHRNTCPTMRVFCYLLLRDMYNKRASEASEAAVAEDGIEMTVSAVATADDCKKLALSVDPQVAADKSKRRAALKWAKLYTLACNPSLAPLSKCHYVDVLGQVDYGQVQVGHKWRPKEEEPVADDVAKKSKAAKRVRGMEYEVRASFEEMLGENVATDK